MRSAILEGRIVVLMDGSPRAIILPVTFFSFFQSPDDIIAADSSYIYSYFVILPASSQSFCHLFISP
ncbi:spore germination protein [Bacillus sp. SL00103]